MWSTRNIGIGIGPSSWGRSNRNPFPPQQPLNLGEAFFVGSVSASLPLLVPASLALRAGSWTATATSLTWAQRRNYMILFFWIIHSWLDSPSCWHLHVVETPVFCCWDPLPPPPVVSPVSVAPATSDQQGGQSAPGTKKIMGEAKRKIWKTHVE